jgi:glutamate-1-semialdehyde 2,1-aminomutase
MTTHTGTIMDFSKSLSLVERFHSRIPGGSHTYAKGDDQYPAHMLPYVVRGEGCRMWDVDANEFIEWGMGLRAVTLGHAYPPVVEAARRAMLDGTNFIRPTLIELEAAEALLDIIQGADMSSSPRTARTRRPVPCECRGLTRDATWSPGVRTSHFSRSMTGS